MKTLSVALATVALVLAGGLAAAVQDKGAVTVHEVGAGLKLQGELGKTQAVIYRVKLAAGKTYVIDLLSPNLDALNPFLRLLNAAGNKLAEENDGGGALNARIVHKVDASGSYQVVATCFGKGRGSYTLTVREAKQGERAPTPDEQKRLGEANSLNNQAIKLSQQGKYATAEPLLVKAIDIYKGVLG